MSRKILELFAGTASVGREFEKRGWDLTTVDNDPQFNPTICKDIRDLTPDDIGLPDVVCASPPCECFSVASIGSNWTGGHRAYVPKTQRARDAIALVQTTLDVIDYLDPEFWFVENPRGVLRKLPVMKDIARTTVTYCRYGDTRMKPTDFFGTVHRLQWRAMCHNGHPDHVRAPRGAKTGTQGLKGRVDRSRIPAALGREMCEQIDAWYDANNPGR